MKKTDGIFFDLGGTLRLEIKDAAFQNAAKRELHAMIRPDADVGRAAGGERREEHRLAAHPHEVQHSRGQPGALRRPRRGPGALPAGGAGMKAERTSSRFFGVCFCSPNWRNPGGSSIVMN